MRVFRTTSITVAGCLFWAAGLLSAVICVCDYWLKNDPSLQPRYYIWYLIYFGWFQWYLAGVCILASYAFGSRLAGVFFYLIATQGLIYGLIQAPVPKADDMCFLKQGTIVNLDFHVEEGMGFDSTRITEMQGKNLKIGAGCKCSAYPSEFQDGLHVEACVSVEGIRKMSINSMGRYLKDGVYSRLKIESVSCVKSCCRPPPFFVCMRKRMVERHEEILGQTRGALLSSIVLGDKVVALPDFVKRNFRKSGVSHLLAASGFNLSIFVAALCLALRLFTKSQWVIAGAGMVSVISFVLLAGASPSVVRAAIWAALLLTLKLAHRRVNLLALFCLSMFLHLAFDPFSILDIGWQLSYAATISIICGIDNEGFEQKNFFWRWFKSAATVILMAQAAVLPLACLYFKQVNWLFLASNLLLDPLVAPLTILGFISSWLGLFSRDLAWCLDILSYYPLEYMLSLTKFFGALKFSQLNIHPPAIWILCVYAASFIYFVYSNCKRNYQDDKIFASLVYFLSLILLLLSSICP